MAHLVYEVVNEFKRDFPALEDKQVGYSTSYAMFPVFSVLQQKGLRAERELLDKLRSLPPQRSVAPEEHRRYSRGRCEEWRRVIGPSTTKVDHTKLRELIATHRRVLEEILGQLVPLSEPGRAAKRPRPRDQYHDHESISPPPSKMSKSGSDVGRSNYDALDFLIDSSRNAHALSREHQQQQQYQQARPLSELTPHQPRFSFSSDLESVGKLVVPANVADSDALVDALAGQLAIQFTAVQSAVSKLKTQFMEEVGFIQSFIDNAGKMADAQSNQLSALFDAINNVARANEAKISQLYQSIDASTQMLTQTQTSSTGSFLASIANLPSRQNVATIPTTNSNLGSMLLHASRSPSGDQHSSVGTGNTDYVVALEEPHQKQQQLTHAMAVAYLSEDTKPIDTSKFVVRVHGVAPSTREHDILSFFSGLSIVPHGVLISNDDTGLYSDAFVEFADESSFHNALGRNKSLLGHRQVDLSPTTRDEVLNQNRKSYKPSSSSSASASSSYSRSADGNDRDNDLDRDRARSSSGSRGGLSFGEQLIADANFPGGVLPASRKYTMHEPTRTVWVGQWKHWMTDDWIRDQFDRFGPITSIYVAPSKKCFFLHYETVEEAKAAVAYHWKYSLDFPINFQPLDAKGYRR